MSSITHAVGDLISNVMNTVLSMFQTMFAIISDVFGEILNVAKGVLGFLLRKSIFPFPHQRYSYMKWSILDLIFLKATSSSLAPLSQPSSYIRSINAARGNRL